MAWNGGPCALQNASVQNGFGKYSWGWPLRLIANEIPADAAVLLLYCNFERSNNCTRISVKMSRTQAIFEEERKSSYKWAVAEHLADGAPIDYASGHDVSAVGILYLEAKLLEWVKLTNKTFIVQQLKTLHQVCQGLTIGSNSEACAT